ncbi:MAG: nickel pincer cofactor biosynthesis protein LarB [Thermoprotei archaeon]|nr:MAG: nickel pincer cofactor biosynthesis protein LarB [Thermoprotei archaeon]
MLRELLRKVANNEISVEEAERRIKLLVLEEVEGRARLDVGRELRRGVPEVILAEGKDRATLAQTVARMMESVGRAVVSRIGREEAEWVVRTLKLERFRYEEAARMLIAYSKEYERPRTGGRVAVLAAGTADVPIAEEVRVMAEEMGCDVLAIYDVGLAALHRTLEALKQVVNWNPDVVVIVAGREAAIASLVASLLDVVVVGVPTSVGYGLGSGGISALTSMLQSCPLGIAVVNIDGGVPGGVAAALIANRAASRRATKRETQ